MTNAATPLAVFVISYLNTGPTASRIQLDSTLKTHIRRSTEQRRKETEKVYRRIASYRTDPRTWSTKACVKKLPKKWLLDLCEEMKHVVLTGLP